MKKVQKKTEELMDLPIRPMFPNMVTMMALACGISSMQFAFWSNWGWAVGCIALAAIFDALDGRVARMLNTSSRFGAELDSLSDLVSFGVAPGFLLYQWTMDPAIRASAVAEGIKDPSAVGVPWMIVLFFAMCCALRLARFNTMLDDEPQPPYWKHFFMGLPAPGGAYLGLLPIIFYLWTKNDFFKNECLVCCFMVISAILMASRIPTPCFKKVHLPKLKPAYRQLTTVAMLALLAGFVTLMFKNFWAFASIVGLIYILMLPAGFVFFFKQKRLYR